MYNRYRTQHYFPTIVKLYTCFFLSDMYIMIGIVLNQIPVCFLIYPHQRAATLWRVVIENIEKNTTAYLLFLISCYRSFIFTVYFANNSALNDNIHKMGLKLRFRLKFMSMVGFLLTMLCGCSLTLLDAAVGSSDSISSKPMLRSLGSLPDPSRNLNWSTRFGIKEKKRHP